MISADSFTLRVKEDEKYRIRFDFHVQREIVCGLKYLHKVTRLVPVAKEQYMIGSYPPSTQLVSFLTPWETTPSGNYCFMSNFDVLFPGILARGSYRVHSKIVDDDGNVYSDFNWTLEISSSW